MIIKETIVWSLNNFAWFSSVVFLEIFVEESPGLITQSYVFLENICRRIPRFNYTKLWLLKKQLCVCDEWPVRVECEQMCPDVIIIISHIIRKP